ncbi:hypothetical protein BCR37DRAFT_91772 [Protomyces lactucae-debilis]|uniref:Uncharacterized protein n=1 Tax=Protomyces lactucae-debilis TaxID=2754530 RepID=A0A1Y2F6C5_PROLT|nr:uncharacterized protein BCR37DRAFT_91772 [Protomyces lactucae-debilis]ORY79442.1 hypothetical protein BCR37DRAFT_91772 [Protomyces lactucae-debilis]
MLNLDSAGAKQAARLLALATDDQHARILLDTLDLSVFPASFTEPAQPPRAGIATDTANNEPMALSDSVSVSSDTPR